ncbi:MAG: Gfo/Idh/MocA family oxidoreductase [Paludibacteraceae bacterium]|nr:Gfo/Idh/MocA family oxidoreductase [Paludibacteraceae bacterium]
MHYDIAFVGLGSIGTRHLRNVCALLDKWNDTYTIDLYRSSIGKMMPDDIACLVSNEYLFSAELPAQVNYDIVFVTNPTALHYDTLLKFKDNTKSFFIEKPIFNTTEVDTDIWDKLKDVTCYVACPLRYNPVLQYIKKNVQLKKVISARAISSSYLPDWRPGQDYRVSYSAHRDMGGGVGIDLIHEWDYLTMFFGVPEMCYSIQDKISPLEIDSDDIAIYIAKTRSTTVELHLDYFGRESIRTLDLFLPEDTLHCDILNGSVEYMSSGEILNFNGDRNAFQLLEIEHFFDIINHKIENDSTAEHAFAVLKLAKGEL